MQERRFFNLIANAPTLLIVLSAPVLAVILLLFLSIRVNDGSLLAFSFTLENYAQALSSWLFWLILGRSLLIAAIVTFSSVVLAYPMAYFIAFHGGKRKSQLMAIVTLPFWTSYLLRIFAWKIILGYNGVVNSAMVSLGIPGAPFEVLLYTPQAMTLTLAHAYAAFAILPLFVSLSAIDIKLIDAARDLGAGGRSIFFRIILPLSRPGIISASILVFIPTLGDYATPTLVGGPSSTMIGNLIQSQFGVVNNWPYGSAMAVLTAMLLGAVILSFALFNRFRSAYAGK